MPKTRIKIFSAWKECHNWLWIRLEEREPGLGEKNSFESLLQQYEYSSSKGIQLQKDETQ